VYLDQAAPVEAAFEAAGVLRNFEITAGIPETLPHLLAYLQRYVPSSETEEEDQDAAAAVGLGGMERMAGLAALGRQRGVGVGGSQQQQHHLRSHSQQQDVDNGEARVYAVGKRWARA
jgi:hypothetical protein